MGLFVLLTITDVLTSGRCGWVCAQPLILPVDQNPLAAFLQHQAPTATCQAVPPFSEQARIPAAAVTLTAPDYCVGLTVHPLIGNGYPYDGL